LVFGRPLEVCERSIRSVQQRPALTAGGQFLLFVASPGIDPKPGLALLTPMDFTAAE
jgi:hypothetical protein